ncbi:MAG: hypothetical protein R2751_10225 [Bacteroidales bacterium]
MIWAKDGTRPGHNRRFDRIGQAGKVPVEDFAQPSGGYSRDTKYNASMEKVWA